MTNALNAASGGRDTVAFVNSGHTGGDIEKIINQISATAKADGKKAVTLTQEEQLLDECRNSLRGVSHCFAAAVFYSSPTEGAGGHWNYSLRADGGLGSKIVVQDKTNDQEIYVLPLQHSIDFAIANLNGTGASLPSEVYEYPYTTQSEKERNNQIRIRYMGGIIEILAVAFLIGMVGVTYQLTGLMASEREGGMSQLIDAMMPNKRRWEPQLARFFASHLAFDIIYVPGWVVIAIILGVGVFAKTSMGIMIVFHIISGLALSSWSIFFATFFKRAQLSGISAVIVSLLLGVLAQVVLAGSGTGAVAVLSLLFPPMNYVFFIIIMARWERANMATNLIHAAPNNPWSLPGIVLWVFFIIQIFAFPVLGGWVERMLYGTASASRSTSGEDTSNAVTLNGFSKLYKPNWFYKNIAPLFGGKRRDTVLAVNDLTLDIHHGQIMVLLGANGSGKSTSLDAIAGLTTITSGAISLNGTGGLGYAPQKNVLWDELTVQEHVRIFNKLKATGKPDAKNEIEALIKACDMEPKKNARSKTLSGGQKRKVQLAMMFTGGSTVCCVDEVSSGLDPISRRKIWDILLAERGARTIILTTHFLDEADLLSDHIAILSKGNLKANGSAVELKHKLGGGYRVHLYNASGVQTPSFEGVQRKVLYDQTIYSIPDSAQAARFVAQLESQGIHDYSLNGPTIEDVFLKLAEEVQLETEGKVTKKSPETPKDKELATEVEETDLNGDEKASETDDRSPKLVTGKRIGQVRQAVVLFRKRITILRRNYLPYLAAFLIPVIGAGLVTLFLKNYTMPGCSGIESVDISEVDSLVSQANFELVLGPSSRLSRKVLQRFAATLPSSSKTGATNTSAVLANLRQVDSYDDFNRYIKMNYANVTPGGFYLGDDQHPPTFAWKGNGDNIAFATIVQNSLDTLLTNVSISNQFSSFDVPFPSSAGKTLQLIVYFGLCMACYPAFFALYPTVERLRNVRALHYSNGVRSLPLWLAYVSFDFLFVLSTSIISTVIFRGYTDQFYGIGYLFVVFFLYGLASTLLAYVVSLFSRSQLAAFALCAGYQAVMFLLYMIAYLSVLTYAPVNKIDSYILVVHFAIATITPTGNLIRALFAALNEFQILCKGRAVASYPGDITIYGGPILYLVLQTFALFGILLWFDSGFSFFRLFRKSSVPTDAEDTVSPTDTDVTAELSRVSSSNDGLRVIHLSKSFGPNRAVDDVSFGVSRGEVFALLGPNGAGKSTTISLIRGDIRPDRKAGDVFVENIPVSKARAAARAHLGVCPQFDAMDTMTVIEHLQFYARIRGVPDVNHNVSEVIRAVGLERFSTRMAAALSGGNKRKLSLGIALMGNPSVLLLDEPSSGMDAASKRVMWRTLASCVPGRSLVLTTHSMEEADALASRAGIMARRMLALGTTDDLRKRWGDAYHIHLVTKSAPHTSAEEMARIREWIVRNFDGAVVEDKTYHGQLRFSVPTRQPSSSPSSPSTPTSETDDIAAVEPIKGNGNGKGRDDNRGISALFSTLEDNKDNLGFEYYSVSQTTLDQVFLAIVGRHDVEEENYGAAGASGSGGKGGLRRLLRFGKK